jgi:hypothetical protein
LAVGVASKISFDGHAGQVTPSASGTFGSPLRAKAPRLAIIACRGAGGGDAGWPASQDDDIECSEQGDRTGGLGDVSRGFSQRHDSPPLNPGRSCAAG